MAATLETFVSAFPEFQNADAAQVTFWLEQAGYQLNASLFGRSFDLATMLFAAHNITLGAKEMATASKGAAFGAASGVVSSKSVGGVSVSYDTGLTATDGAGAWNATTYGQRLYKMMQAACGGGVYRTVARFPVWRR